MLVREYRMINMIAVATTVYCYYTPDKSVLCILLSTKYYDLELKKISKSN